jgi:DNA-binding transcriptional LysR family regulator
MELRHLRYFVTVAECGNISRAAEELFIAQPPLSLQIRHLEEELGTPLLIRYPRGVRLTPAGERFLREAKDLLARADHAKRSIQGADSDDGGQLRIGIVPSVGHTMLPRLLRDFKKLRPKCELDVAEMITEQQLQALRRREINIGIMRKPFSSVADFSLIESADPFCLAIPFDHPFAGTAPLELKHAAQETFVSFTRHRGQGFFDQTISLCMDAGFSPNIRYEASTLFGVLDMVSAGLGVALVPASATLLNPQHVNLRLLRQQTRPGVLALVRRQNDPDPAVTAFANLATGIFAEFGKELQRTFPKRKARDRKALTKR